jgi:hypothetical protein
LLVAPNDATRYGKGILKTKPSKRRSAASTPEIEFLRSHSDPYLRGRWHGDRDEAGHKLIPYNHTSDRFWNLIHFGVYPPRKLPNWEYDAHFNGEYKLYFCGNPRGWQDTTWYFDFDCKNRRHRKEAQRFIKWLKETFFRELVVEDSSGRLGLCGYLHVSRFGYSNPEVNDLMKQLERTLETVRDHQGFTFHRFELKGSIRTTAAERTQFNKTHDKKLPEKDTFGSLAKSPSRTAATQLLQTEETSCDEIKKLLLRLKEVLPPENDKQQTTKTKRSGSTSIIKPEHVEQLPRIAAYFKQEGMDKLLAGDGRHYAHAVHFACAMVLFNRWYLKPPNTAKNCQQHPEWIGTVSGALIQAAWNKAYAEGLFPVPWHSSVWTRVRDELTEMGLFEWEEHGERYTIGSVDEDGNKIGGIACKFALSAHGSELFAALTAETAGQEAKADVPASNSSSCLCFFYTDNHDFQDIPDYTKFPLYGQRITPIRANDPPQDAATWDFGTPIDLNCELERIWEPESHRDTAHVDYSLAT